LALGLVWRHRYRRISLEDYKLRSMLDKLEKLYSSGEIEEKIYRKLKEEYTDRLKKLSKKG
jgi:isocitrate dehydrogenase kinase/phosphatase